MRVTPFTLMIVIDFTFADCPKTGLVKSISDNARSVTIPKEWLVALSDIQLFNLEYGQTHTESTTSVQEIIKT